MTNKRYGLNLGLSDYAITAYLALLRHQPANGSQLSRHSGIPRARIYDVLRTLSARGFVTEASKGMYVPLPPEELIDRLRKSHEADLATLERILEQTQPPADQDYIWTITGYRRVISTAEEMIAKAQTEIYVRLFSQEANLLVPALKQAQRRGVAVKCIFMAPFRKTFKYQVIHPDHTDLERSLGGRSFDLVIDKAEFIGGMFTTGHEDEDRINWGRNRWSVTAGRDSLRHDFFHYFLHKTYQLGETLDRQEQTLYKMILMDG